MKSLYLTRDGSDLGVIRWRNEIPAGDRSWFLIGSTDGTAVTCRGQAGKVADGPRGPSPPDRAGRDQPTRASLLVSGLTSSSYHDGDEDGNEEERKADDHGDEEDLADMRTLALTLAFRGRATAALPATAVGCTP
jgi:hypothetical protein